jgi:Ca-activated chloride channel family protein
MSQIRITAECERRLVAAEVASQRTVEWTVAADQAGPRAERAPLTIALVLDRSGSMGGQKLRFVQQAACHVLDTLDERDRVAVVAYDDQVALVAGCEPLTAQRRETIKAQVNALTPGGTTDLAGGWLEGCRAVAERLGAGVNRALLLTDGLANRGITDTEELARHARELRARGVATSTFGVGLDFNEHLLTALAEQGGGHFYYIERPPQIPEVFRAELSELLAVIAREATLAIDVPRGVSLEVLGDLPHERAGGRVRIFLGDIAAGERRAIYTRALTPPDAPGASVVLRGELSYADLSGRGEATSAEIGLSYVREAEALLAPVLRELLARAGEVELATAAARALRLERAGQRQEAQAAMQQALAASAPYAPAPAAAAYTDLAARLRHGLSEEDRKQTQFDTYKKRQSRG